MNFIKNFKKTQIATFLVSIILLISCTVDDDPKNLSVDSDDLKTMHANLLGNQNNNSFKRGGTSASDYFSTEELNNHWNFVEESFPSALSYAREFGSESLLIEYGYNPNIINISESLKGIFQSDMFYEELARYNLSEADNQNVIIYLEFDNYLSDLYEDENVDVSAMDGCDRAIVSSLLVTAGAAVATVAAGPTGVGALALGSFLVTKAWATYNLIQSCRD
ncbi:hypothetical protein [Flavobacterium sp. CS20]|uniref:hypothetical protein n=1 Tax=Flavobacterium sp. CS20 TaxID=2775246 RepID=UPI001B3A2281|nr:hypothetical protein [Flavobacterium sp. CS20]QTY27100.1 hypothetical protein IGB25_00350 [Flavobacterium sp. CS20]